MFCKDKHFDLLLIYEEEKEHYVLIKGFNTLMYDHTLHHGRKSFCRYCLQPFRTAHALTCHIKNCFKINGKQRIKIQTIKYTNKYQTHVACSYNYKLLCVNDKFSKPFKSYLGEDKVYNFINSMVDESKCCNDVMKKHFYRELVMIMTIQCNLLNAGFVIMLMLKVMLK